MLLKEIIKTSFAKMGYGVMREGAFEAAVRDEARQAAWVEVREGDPNASGDGSLTHEDYAMRCMRDRHADID